MKGGIDIIHGNSRVRVRRPEVAVRIKREPDVVERDDVCDARYENKYEKERVSNFLGSRGSDDKTR